MAININNIFRFSNEKIWKEEQENRRTIYFVKNEDLTLIFSSEAPPVTIQMRPEKDPICYLP